LCKAGRANPLVLFQGENKNILWFLFLKIIFTLLLGQSVQARCRANHGRAKTDLPLDQDYFKTTGLGQTKTL